MDDRAYLQLIADHRAAVLRATMSSQPADTDTAEELQAQLRAEMARRQENNETLNP